MYVTTSTIQHQLFTALETTSARSQTTVFNVETPTDTMAVYEVYCGSQWNQGLQENVWKLRDVMFVVDRTTLDSIIICSSHVCIFEQTK